MSTEPGIVHRVSTLRFHKSSYAPNGDSGTFVFDSNHNLISGSASALSQIRQEAYEADPTVIEQAYNSEGGAESTVNNAGFADFSPVPCAAGAAGLSAIAIGFLNPADYIALTGLMSYLPAFGRWFSECF